MIQFAVAQWQPGDRDAEHRADFLRADILAREQNARVAILQKRWSLIIWQAGGARGNVYPLGEEDGAIVGHIFARDSDDDPRRHWNADCRSQAGFIKFCDTLCRNFWGAYVVVRASPAPDSIGIFRDPIGAIDCVCHERDGLRIATSSLASCVSALDTSDIGIAWELVPRSLYWPGTIADDPLLTGVIAVQPGTVLEFGAGTTANVTLWTAASFAGRRPEHDITAGDFHTVVRKCVTAWRNICDDYACEVSGGLDSAIVVACLGKGEAVEGYNYYSHDMVGDERRYARAVAESAGLNLNEISLPVRSLSLDDLADLPTGNRPPIGALGLFHDRDLARRVSGTSAKTIFTGQGGDAVFFQHAAIELAKDCHGSFREQFDQMADLARWTNRSIWSVVAQRVRFRRRIQRPVPPQFITEYRDSAVPASVWAGNTEELPPSKHLHIAALTQARLAFGATWTTSAATVIHPLMSQPIVEVSLEAPVMRLTEGFRDRGLARRAFMDVVPKVVVQRHGKGALTPLFGQSLARSVPFLREWLLDGLLAANHVIRRNELEHALHENYLMQHNIYPELVWLILIENWARGWTGILRDASSRTVPALPIG